MSLLGNFPNRAIILFLSNCFRLYKVIFFILISQHYPNFKFFCKYIEQLATKKNPEGVEKKDCMLLLERMNPMIHPAVITTPKMQAGSFRKEEKKLFFR